jgi:hypothetical protein
MRHGTARRTWTKMTGGIVGSLICVAVFTPWGSHAPCPARPGRLGPICEGTRTWTNLLGWDFHASSFPVAVLILSGLAGFAIGWFLVALAESLLHREKARALG